MRGPACSDEIATLNRDRANHGSASRDLLLDCSEVQRALSCVSQAIPCVEQRTEFIPWPPISEIRDPRIRSRRVADIAEMNSEPLAVGRYLRRRRGSARIESAAHFHACLATRFRVGPIGT